MKRNLRFVLSQWRPQRDGVSDCVGQLAKAWGEAGCGGAEVVAWEGESVRLAPAVAHAPTTIAWHVVPWAWHRRGLLGHVGARLRRAFPEGARDIYFHEVWLGEKPGLPLRQRFLGWMQRRSMQRAVRAWHPATVHTSNPVYAAALAAQGWSPQLLPLPSPVPIWAGEAPSARARAWSRQAPEVLRVVVPFSLVTGWPVAAFVAALSRVLPEGKRRMAWLSVGAQGAGQAVWHALQQAAPQDWSFVAWGPAEEAEISYVLQVADVGLTTHSWSLLGKSSGAAAMRDHGLPVICVHDPPETRRPVDGAAPSGLQAHRWAPGKEDAFNLWLRTRARQEPRSYAPSLARQLAQQLAG